MWTGAKNAEGYGVIGAGGNNGQKLRAHRVVYAEAKGVIPEGKIIMHTCDAPACCNPAHLVLGTHAENVADKIRKGRCYTGDHRGKNSKVTPTQVRRIRKAKGTQMEIADRFGIGQTTVSDILNRKTWSHIT